MNRRLPYELMLWVLALAPLLYLWQAWDALPDRVATHWGASGEPNGWSDRSSLPWMIGGLGIGIYLLMLLVPQLDPRRRNLDTGSRSYQNLRLVLQLMFAFIGYAIVRGAEMETFDAGAWLMPGLFLFMAAIGNYMYSLRSNYFIGIRTPWTLEYPEIWERTHRLGGRLWFWLGLIGAAGALLLREDALAAWTVGLILLMTLIPMAYSFVLFKQGVGRKDP
jgi:uncharacterized membrane protein